MYYLKFVVFIAVLLSAVNAHSWVQCADYTEENGQFWASTKCRGYPRDYATRFTGTAGTQLGVDVGFDYHVSETRPCLSNKTAASYSTTYPAASFNAGQRVCMAWPTKNHVAAACNNPYIPDHGTQVYRSGLNPTSDPPLSVFKQNLVHDFGTNTVSGAGVGFQNCPNFCQDAGTSLCTGCFVIPNLAVGTYTFLWTWAFNSLDDVYGTCMDVNIVANSGNAITSTLPHVGPDAFRLSTTGTVTGVASSTSTGSASTTAPATQPPTTPAPTSPATQPPTTPAPTSPATQPPTTAATQPPTGAPCQVGSEKCACTKGGACDTGLICASGLCVNGGNLEASSSFLAPSAIVVCFLVLLGLLGF